MSILEGSKIMDNKKDLLDKTVAFLAKREGIDKTLKIIRYTSRLVAAVSVPGTEVNLRASGLEKSVGVSRKAFRLGKFLQDVNKLRRVKLDGYVGLLELMTYTGEGVYYFIEQFAWLMKTGAMSKKYEKSLSRISAWAEIVGYASNILLTSIKIRELRRREDECWAELKAQSASDLDGCVEVSKRLRTLQSLRLLQMSYMVQDLADSLLALNDIRGVPDSHLAHPVLLSIAGLISAAVSTYKNWTQ